MLSAAIEGRLNETLTLRNDVFNLDVPAQIEGVPEKLLQPDKCWDSMDTYNSQAKRLAALFIQNFKKFEEKTGQEIVMAGPKINS